VGSLVAADIVLKRGPDQTMAKHEFAHFQREILEICHENLAVHKIPATIRCVPALEIAAAGKLVRPHA
jgi:acyl-CoA synthetase (AMP-forming)/AMP-acid ligase II